MLGRHISQFSHSSFSFQCLTIKSLPFVIAIKGGYLAIVENSHYQDITAELLLHSNRPFSWVYYSEDDYTQLVSAVDINKERAGTPNFYIRGCADAFKKIGLYK